MNTSEHINEIATALAKAQAQIQPATKDKTNPAFRSRYADLTSIWEACRAPLTENGIAVVQMPVDSTDGRVALVTTLLHASGQFISSMVSTRLVKDDPQGVGSALTYLRRYALAAMVGVVADEDDDGNAASGRGAAPVQQRPEPRSQKSEARTQEPKDEGASDKQLGMLAMLRDELGWTKAQSAAFVRARQMDPATLTKAQASTLIEAFQNEVKLYQQEAQPPSQPSLSDEYDEIDPPAAKNGAVAGVTK